MNKFRWVSLSLLAISSTLAACGDDTACRPSGKSQLAAKESRADEHAKALLRSFSEARKGADSAIVGSARTMCFAN